MRPLAALPRLGYISPHCRRLLSVITLAAHTDEICLRRSAGVTGAAMRYALSHSMHAATRCRRSLYARRRSTHDFRLPLSQLDDTFARPARDCCCRYESLAARHDDYRLSARLRRCPLLARYRLCRGCLLIYQSPSRIRRDGAAGGFLSPMLAAEQSPLASRHVAHRQAAACLDDAVLPAHDSYLSKSSSLMSR